MAENQSSAGAAVLAAAAAGAGAGVIAVVAVPHPLDDVGYIFTALGMTNTQRGGMNNVHNFTSMDNFDSIRVDDTKSLVKVWNETSQAVTTKFVIPTQHKLQGLLYWYHDQRKRGLISAVADFDVATMRLTVGEFDAENRARNWISRNWVQVRLKWTLNGSILNLHS